MYMSMFFVQFLLENIILWKKSSRNSVLSFSKFQLFFHFFMQMLAAMQTKGSNSRTFKRTNERKNQGQKYC